MRSSKILTILVFLTLSTGFSLKAQLSRSEEWQEKAEKYFRSGDFSNALELYTKLTGLFPDEPEFLYYSGVCIWELNRTDRFDQAAASLEKAAVYGKEMKAWFYLGRVQQSLLNPERAVEAYNRFIEKGKKRDIRKLHVEDLLLQAENELKNKEKKIIPVNEQPITAVNRTDLNLDIKPAFDYQLLADSMIRSAKLKRAKLKRTDDPAERKILSGDIYFLERLAKLNQKKADSVFSGVVLKYNLNENRHEPDTFEQAIRIIDPENDEFTGALKFDCSDSLMYTIQLGIFMKKTENSMMNRLSPLYFKEDAEKGTFTYLAGKFPNYQSAYYSLQNLKRSGFSDVFIIAFYQKNQIAVEKAREIEYSGLAF